MSNTDRQIELELWMEERKLTAQTLATAMGVSRQFVSKMLDRETIPAKRYRQLLLYGIPKELLPPPFDGTFGRPRKILSIQPEAMAAHA